jgi:hypothetical protein
VPHFYFSLQLWLSVFIFASKLWFFFPSLSWNTILTVHKNSYSLPTFFFSADFRIYIWFYKQGYLNFRVLWPSYGWGIPQFYFLIYVWSLVVLERVSQPFVFVHFNNRPLSLSSLMSTTLYLLSVTPALLSVSETTALTMLHLFFRVVSKHSIYLSSP